MFSNQRAANSQMKREVLPDWQGANLAKWGLEAAAGRGKPEKKGHRWHRFHRPGSDFTGVTERTENECDGNRSGFLTEFTELTKWKAPDTRHSTKPTEFPRQPAESITKRLHALFVPWGGLSARRKLHSETNSIIPAFIKF